MIKLYTTGCPRCKVLKKKLDENNLNYETITDEAMIIAACKENATDTVPLLEVDGKFYDFSAAIKWVGEQTNVD